MEVAPGRLTETFRLDHVISSSRDGHWLSYSDAGSLFGPVRVFVVNAATGHQRQVAQLPPGNIFTGSPAWLPDNRHLVISYLPSARRGRQGDLGILDIQDDDFAPDGNRGGRLRPRAQACRPWLRLVSASAGSVKCGRCRSVPIRRQTDGQPFGSSMVQRAGTRCGPLSPATVTRCCLTVPPAGVEPVDDAGRPQCVTAPDHRRAGRRHLSFIAVARRLTRRVRVHCVGALGHLDATRGRVGSWPAHE